MELVNLFGRMIAESKPTRLTKPRCGRSHSGLAIVLGSGEVRRLARRSGKFEYVHARVRTVDDVDVTAVIHLDVIRLDGDLATLVRAGPDTALVCLAGNGGNVIGDFPGLQWIADIESAHAGVKVSDEQHAVVIDRREVLI